MTLTASGQIKFSEINTEFGRTSTTANTSLEDLSDGTVATINTANDAANRPDGSAPHAISEFYSYDHDAAAANASFGTWSDTTIRFVFASPGDGTQNHGVTTNALTDASGKIGCDDTINSGTARGSLKIAVSNTGDPGTSGTANSGTGFEGANNNTLAQTGGVGSTNGVTVNFSGSVTAYVRFNFTPHATQTENVDRTMDIENNNTTNSDINVDTVVTSFGGFCVHEAVPVNCINYYKHISELEVGDMVMSYNFETNSVEEVEILQIEKPRHDDLIVYKFNDMEDVIYTHIENGKKIATNSVGLAITKDHPIYKEDGTMVCLDPAKAKELYGLDAEEIQKGDRIRFMDSIKTVDTYSLAPDETETYTILTKNNNFYAGGVLVHSEIT